MRANLAVYFRGQNSRANLALVKVSVNFDNCASTGACTQMCPEVFEIRSDGFLHILNENPSEELRESLTAAEEICPTGAIAIEQ